MPRVRDIWLSLGVKWKCWHDRHLSTQLWLQTEKFTPRPNTQQLHVHRHEHAFCSRWYDSHRPDALMNKNVCQRLWNCSESLPFFKFYIPVIIEMFQYMFASFWVGPFLRVHHGDVISFKWKGWLEGSLRCRGIFSYKILRQSWGSERQVKCWGGEKR